MRIKPLWALLCLPVALAAQAHGDNTLFHAMTLELDAGDSRTGESVASWDLDGWVGGDQHKLWLKSEGDLADHATESSETWALYSRQIDTFWDIQAGVRYDHRPHALRYGVIGVTGLAPFHIETELHLFTSEDGDTSLRLHADTDFLLSQQLILQPYVEVNAFAQAVQETDTGSGLSDASAGLQLRYEVTRRFAPYIQLEVERLLGETADIASDQGEHRSDTTISAGIRLLF